MTRKIGLDRNEAPLDMVSVFGLWGGWSLPGSFSMPVTSATYEGANRTIYLPLHIPTYVPVRRLWWVNGSSSGAGTIRMGIYADAGHKPGVLVCSTSGTTQGTINQVQFDTPTTTPTISPGPYWIALAGTATTLTFQSKEIGVAFSAVTKFQEATGTPPATATPVKGANVNVWHIGFSTVDTP